MQCTFGEQQCTVICCAKLAGYGGKSRGIVLREVHSSYKN